MRRDGRGKGKAIIVVTAEAIAKQTGVEVPYTVGTVIERPRAALQAGELFSFSTNDLTQMALGGIAPFAGDIAQDIQGLPNQSGVAARLLAG